VSTVDPSGIKIFKFGVVNSDRDMSRTSPCFTLVTVTLFLPIILKLAKELHKSNFMLILELLKVMVLEYHKTPRFTDQFKLQYQHTL
jgi:hypothetical protein